MTPSPSTLGQDAGTVGARFDWLMDQLQELVGDSASELCADPPEARYIAAIKVLKSRQPHVALTGWLIEIGSGTPMYFDGSHFDSDHMKAIRFARREDAQKFGVHRLRDSGFPFRVVEHAWDDRLCLTKAEGG